MVVFNGSSRLTCRQIVKAMPGSSDDCHSVDCL